jgi:hypothetical protein
MRCHTQIGIPKPRNRDPKVADRQWDLDEDIHENNPSCHINEVKIQLIEVSALPILLQIIELSYSI